MAKAVFNTRICRPHISTVRMWECAPIKMLLAELCHRYEKELNNIEVFLGFCVNNILYWKHKPGELNVQNMDISWIVLFNDTLNTFYLQLYGIGHIVKDHSDSERGNLLSPHGLLFLINSKDSFICTIPQTTYHGLCYTSHGALARMRNSSMGPPPWRIDPTTFRTMNEHSYYGATSRSMYIMDKQNKYL